MRYYYSEHIAGYDRIKAEGKTAWNEIHGQEGFDNFASRSFLEAAFGRLVFSTHRRMALEYGYGTGPGACFLAEHGFEVEAIDLIPTAIEIAQEIARKRSLTIDFRVADICCLPNSRKNTIWLWTATVFNASCSTMNGVASSLRFSPGSSPMGTIS